MSTITISDRTPSTGDVTRPRTAPTAEPMGRVARRGFAIGIVLIGLHVLDGVVVHGDRALTARFLWGLGTILTVAAAAFAFRRRGRGIRSALAMGIGAGATIGGLALTVPHAVKAGVAGSDITGVASLGAGLALLALGTGIVLGSLDKWRKLIAIPVGAAIVYYVMAPMALAVYATHPAVAASGGPTPSVAGLAYRDVTVTTADGVELSAWYVPSSNRAAVVVLHGAGSTRSAVLRHVIALGRAGYGVLALDARGHGASEGRAMDYGWYGEIDVTAAVSFLAGRTEVDPSRIGAIGLSMGGEEALTAAAADPRIAAVVSEGASMRSFADVGSIPAPPVNRWLSAPFYWVQFAVADLMTPAHQPIGLEEALVRIAPRPVLLIAGGGSEIGFNRRYVSAAPGSTELWALPDTPHTQALVRHPQAWARRVIGFLDDSLLG